ncbi:MAG: serine kinase [Chloroflexota bacterium]
MTVQELVTALGLCVVAGQDRLDRQVTGGYASDLLSCVMARASQGNAWVTLQAHPNVLAVAELLELACVIISEGTQPDPETLAKAGDRGIALLLAQESTFTIAGKLYELGIRASERANAAR